MATSAIPESLLEDLVRCELCGFYFGQITDNHLRNKHGMSYSEYEGMFPEALIRSASVLKAMGDRWTLGERERASRQMTATNLKVWGDLGRRREREEANARVWNQLSQEERQHRIEQRLIYVCDEECRENMSRAAKKRWARASPEERRRHTEPARMALQARPNEPERILWEFLEQKFPGMFIPDWISRADIGGRYPDFRTKNGYKVIIESFGTYWHNPIEFPKRFSEEELVALYKKEGYDCIVVWADYPEDIIFEWPNIADRIRTILEGK